MEIAIIKRETTGSGTLWIAWVHNLKVENSINYYFRGFECMWQNWKANFG